MRSENSTPKIPGEDLGSLSKAKEVYSSPRLDKRPQWKRRIAEQSGRDGLNSPAGQKPGANRASLEDGQKERPPGYTRPNWESRVYEGWISGGRSFVRHADAAQFDVQDREWRETGPGETPIPYAELHCHTNYSFKEGASEGWDLLVRAHSLGIHALAITDHDNLCGAMEFAQSAKAVGIKAIIGAEATLSTPSAGGMGRHHVTLLARNATGYSNLCQLLTKAHMEPVERNQPALDPAHFAQHAEGLICLSGCRQGQLSELLLAGEYETARSLARQYAEWFGENNYFLELQQNLVKGDTARNRLLARLGRDLGIGLAATNNVHYHIRERHRLNDALTAIQHNKSLEEAHSKRRPNDQFYIKPPAEMTALFSDYPEAITNTTAIAERCEFDLATDIKKVYSFPDYETPEGHTAASWLRRICQQTARHKYDPADKEVWNSLQARLEREFSLIERYKLSGFLLQYRDIVAIAHEIQIELGIVDPHTRLDDQPPGRGRGSSVALVVGYLIGLSHIDPLKFGLGLERFMPDARDGEEIPLPDIDLDFPREIREELILRVHNRKGPEFAVLTGMISTYRVRGAIRDLGKALGLPQEDLAKLIKKMDGHAGIQNLATEMAALPEYRDRLDAPLWKDLLNLASQLNHFPKYLAQHPGGMILSARPLSHSVPLQRSAIDGRFICQWEKNSAEDAGFVKIDFLALGALSQMTEALQLIRLRKEEVIDLSRIDFTDMNVYADIWAADTIGVFQIESAAQMQTVTRLKPRNLEEMAWEVGAVRPGVGVNNGVSMLIRRHLGHEPVEYDHELEIPALERTLGVPLYQDQLAELAVHVAGMTPIEGDHMRRAFARRDSERQVPEWHRRFMAGAAKKGVPKEAAEKIFRKFHGLYQFPEAHAYAFGVTAYQMSWIKHYHPLEFFVGLFNNQPMGFYNLETLKEDAKRHSIEVREPDVNLSAELATIEDSALRIGLKHVARVQSATAEKIMTARKIDGPFRSLADFMARTGVREEPLDNLARAGALDLFDSRYRPRKHRSGEQGRAAAVPGRASDRRLLRWETGLRYRPIGKQLALDMPVDQDMVALPQESQWERMMGEYGAMGIHPESHVMAYVRPMLPPNLERSDRLAQLPEGAKVLVAGIVIRRQRPSGKATFITLEDEFGHSPLIIYPAVYKRIRLRTTAPLLVAKGVISKREGTLSIVVQDIKPFEHGGPDLKTKDWG